MKRRPKNEKPMIRRAQLLDMLKKIHLASAINECVLIFEDGKALAEVVDITNNIIVLANAQINEADKGFRIGAKGFDAEIGIGSIEILMKFLSSVDDEKLTITMSSEGDRMNLSTSKGKRRLVYLTSVPDLISTRLRMQEDDDTVYRDNFLDMPDTSFEIGADDAKDLVGYIGLSRSKVVTITVDEDRAVFTVGSGTEHKFTVEVEVDDEPDDEIVVQTNGENLAKVLSACVFSEDEPTMIGVGEESPIVITDLTTLWGLTPLEDTDGE